MYRNDILKFRYIWSGALRLHHGQSFERFSFPTTSNTQSIAYPHMWPHILHLCWNVCCLIVLVFFSWLEGCRQFMYIHSCHAFICYSLGFISIFLASFLILVSNRAGNVGFDLSCPKVPILLYIDVTSSRLTLRNCCILPKIPTKVETQHGSFVPAPLSDTKPKYYPTLVTKSNIAELRKFSPMCIGPWGPAELGNGPGVG